MIPNHLKNISEIIKSSKNFEEIKIKCICNCNRFWVYEFCEENKINTKFRFDEIIRENNKLYWVRRNFFGRIVEKVENKNEFGHKQRKIVKVICEKCGLEYVIFDNYKHGYDATFIETKEDFLNDVEPNNFKKLPTITRSLYKDLSRVFL